MKNLPISVKIMVLLGPLMLAVIALCIKLIFSMSTVNDQSTVIAESWLPSIQLTSGINTNISDFRIAQLQHVGTKDNEIMNDAERVIAAPEKTIEANIELYKKVITSEEERSMYNKFEVLWSQYKERHKTFLNLSRENKNEEASALLYGPMKQSFDGASATLVRLVEFNKKGAQDASALGDRIYARERMVAVAGLLLLIVFSGYITLLLSRNIAQPISTPKTYMGALQSGNYNDEVPYKERKDEVGAMATSIESCRTSLIQNRAMEEQQRQEAQRKVERQNYIDKLVRDFDVAASASVSSVAAAATELAQTAEEMAKVAKDTSKQAVRVSAGVSQTSGMVQSVASAMEEMSASSREISNQVTTSMFVAKEASTKAGAATETSTSLLSAARDLGDVASIIGALPGKSICLRLMQPLSLPVPGRQEWALPWSPAK